MRSANDKWLESLHISVNGDIIPDGDSLTRSDELLVKRVADRKEQNAVKKTRATSKKAYENATLKSSSIFDHDSSSDESPDGNKNRKSIQDEVEQTAGSEINVTPSEEAGRSRVDDPGKVRGAITNDQKPCFCSKLPAVTSTDIDMLARILDLARLTNERQKLVETPSTGKTQPAKVGLSKIKTIPLFEGSSIRLPEWKIGVYVDTYRKNLRGMVRKLMTEIVGTNNLKKSSPTGKGGWTPIPKDAFEDVEMFVQRNVKRKYRLTHDEYMKNLTAQCATLRNPKKSSRSSTLEGASEEEEPGKKRDEKQKDIAKMNRNGQFNEHAEVDKMRSKQRKNVQKIPLKIQTDEKNERDSLEDEDQNNDDSSRGEASSPDDTDREEEACEAEQPLESNTKNSHKNQEDRQGAHLNREKTSGDTLILENPDLGLLPGNSGATMLSGLHGSIGNTDLSNSSQRIHHDIAPHPNTESLSEDLRATKGSIHEGCPDEPSSSSKPGSLENPSQKTNDSNDNSKIFCGGEEGTTKDEKELFSGQCNIREIDNGDSAYLVKIRELEAKLAEKSAESDLKNSAKKGSRATNKPSGLEKRKTTDDAPQITKRKSKI